MSTKTLNAIVNRVKGELVPVSISTALAIESFVGQNIDSPTDDPQCNKTDVLLINVRTLTRNLQGCVDPEVKNDLPNNEVLEAIQNEMSVIDGTIEEFTKGAVKVIYYIPSYGSYYTGKLKEGILKELKTPNQIFQNSLELAVCDGLKKNKETLTSNIIETNSNLPKMDVRATLITHYPVDLLARYNFTELHLLESHTGAIKNPSMWNTKLQNGRDIPNIPFDRATLQVFGDGVMYRPMNMKIRKAFIEMAEKHQWSAATTEALVKHSAKSAKDPFLGQFVNGLYSVAFTN